MSNNFETVSHSKLFPAKIFTTQVSQCDFHWHTDYEILLILKGTVTVYSADQPSLLKAGDIFMFNSNTIHGVQSTGVPNLCLVIQFSPEVVSGGLVDSRFFYYFHLRCPLECELIGTTIIEISSQMAKIALLAQSRDEYSDLKTYSELLRFIVFLLQHVQYDIRRLPLEKTEDPPDELYEEITGYIRENLRSTNLNGELCRALGIGDKTVYRYLKSTLGISLKELIDITRIEASCRMLRDTVLPISVIWDNCGYASEVSFYRNFKKQMNITPNDYRKGASAARTGYDYDSYSGFNLGEASALLETYAYPHLRMGGNTL